MKCKHCNQEIPDGSVTCPHCKGIAVNIPFAKTAETERPPVFTAQEPEKPVEPQRPTEPIETFEPEKPKKSKKGLIIASICIVLVLLVCVLVGVALLVPDVRNFLFSGNNTEEVQPVAPEYLDIDMPLSQALLADNVSVGIITSYDVGTEPVHTLYLYHNGTSYETNINDEGGSWSYLTPKGRRAIYDLQNNSGSELAFNVESVEPDAQIIAEQNMSLSQIQTKCNNERDALYRQLEEVVKNYMHSGSRTLLTPAAIRLDEEMPISHLLIGEGEVEVKNENYNCEDIKSGIVTCSYTGTTETYFDRITNNVKLKFTVIKTAEGEYLINKWDLPETEEISRERIDREASDW